MSGIAAAFHDCCQGCHVSADAAVARRGIAAVDIGGIQVLHIDMDGVPTGLHGGSRRTAKLEDIETVQLNLCV